MTNHLSREPTTDIGEATNALNLGALPAESPWRVDLSPGRGRDATAPLERLLMRTPGDQFIRAAFVSHRGAGKTTELNQLMARLETEGDLPYTCIYFQANVELDANRFAIEDLLLVMARVVEQKMREELGISLPPAKLGEIEEWFASAVVEKVMGREFVGEIRTQAEAQTGVPLVARLLARMTALVKTESEYRERIERQLRKYPGALTNAINAFLDCVRTKLAGEDRRLLIIVDNMDRYAPSIIDPVLIQDADRFRELHANIVFTPPISLIYAPVSQSIENLYRTFELPTVRLRGKQDAYAEVGPPGKALLEAVIGKRISLDTFLPDEDMRRRILFASGGAVREVLRIVQAATLEVDAPPITWEAVERVLADMRRRLRDRANLNGWWDVLVRIAGTKQLPDDAREICHQLLFQRLVFQYNGEGWYDVHPLITEIPEFRERFSRGGAKS